MSTVLNKNRYLTIKSAKGFSNQRRSHNLDESFQNF